jgi:hypothetical protein
MLDHWLEPVDAIRRYDTCQMMGELWIYVFLTGVLLLLLHCCHLAAIIAVVVVKLRLCCGIHCATDAFVELRTQPVR